MLNLIQYLSSKDRFSAETLNRVQGDNTKNS